jgi:hypothetical protein
MLAGRLKRIIDDILLEYEEFNILSLLNEALQASAERAANIEQTYRARASGIREAALNIERSSRFNTIPDYVAQVLGNSDYAVGLPLNITNVLLRGYPDTMANSMASTEVQIYRDIARRLHSDLQVARNVMNNFNIETIDIPDEMIGIDILLSRNEFEADLIGYTARLRSFVTIFSDFTELTTGVREQPRLTYMSTSDPVIGVIVTAKTAWSIFKWFRRLLDLANKGAEFLGMAKTLQQSGGDLQ